MGHTGQNQEANEMTKETLAHKWPKDTGQTWANAGQIADVKWNGGQND